MLIFSGPPPQHSLPFRRRQQPQEGLVLHVFMGCLGFQHTLPALPALCSPGSQVNPQSPFLVIEYWSYEMHKAFCSCLGRKISLDVVLALDEPREIGGSEAQLSGTVLEVLQGRLLWH